MVKVKKKRSLAQIADELEETTESIQGMYDAVMENPDKTAEEIYNLMHKEENI